MIEPRHEQFLAERAAGVAYAQRGDLLQHLRNTHALLEQWGCAPVVRLAGLYHSIYGTWCVSHRAVSFAQREMVRDLIGAEAEALAYVFCVTERPKDFLAALDRHPIEIRDHHTGTMMPLTRGQLDQLLEIEVANIIEQGLPAFTVLDQYRRGRLAPGAQAAIEAYVAEGRRKDPTSDFLRFTVPS